MEDQFDFLIDYLNPKDYFVASFLFSLIFHALFRGNIIIRPPLSYLGVFLVLLGIGLSLWADFSIKKQGRKKQVKVHGGISAMVTSGPYEFSRHPMYLGYFLILLGMAVFLGSIITFVFPIIFFLMLELIYVPIEEHALERKFGEEYSGYKKKTKRWINF